MKPAERTRYVKTVLAQRYTDIKKIERSIEMARNLLCGLEAGLPEREKHFVRDTRIDMQTAFGRIHIHKEAVAQLLSVLGVEEEPEDE